MQDSTNTAAVLRKFIKIFGDVTLVSGREKCLTNSVLLASQFDYFYNFFNENGFTSEMVINIPFDIKNTFLSYYYSLLNGSLPSYLIIPAIKFSNYYGLKDRSVFDIFIDEFKEYIKPYLDDVNIFCILESMREYDIEKYFINYCPDKMDVLRDCFKVCLKDRYKTCHFLDVIGIDIFTQVISVVNSKDMLLLIEDYCSRYDIIPEDIKLTLYSLVNKHNLISCSSLVSCRLHWLTDDVIMIGLTELIKYRSRIINNFETDLEAHGSEVSSLYILNNIASILTCVPFYEEVSANDKPSRGSVHPGLINFGLINNIINDYSIHPSIIGEIVTVRSSGYLGSDSGISSLYGPLSIFDKSKYFLSMDSPEPPYIEIEFDKHINVNVREVVVKNLVNSRQRSGITHDKSVPADLAVLLYHKNEVIQTLNATLSLGSSVYKASVKSDNVIINKLRVQLSEKEKISLGDIMSYYPSLRVDSIDLFGTFVPSL